MSMKTYGSTRSTLGSKRLSTTFAATELNDVLTAFVASIYVRFLASDLLGMALPTMRPFEVNIDEMARFARTLNIFTTTRPFRYTRTTKKFIATTVRNATTRC